MIFSQLVLNWYHLNGRKNLPWQKKRTPYKIWISEIMLQQTKVKTVIPYFNKFVQMFPTVDRLAKANLNEILYLWSGLGYYKRAKNIYESAKLIKHKYHGIFPNNFYNVIKLPGIGKTTAGAILSLSLGFRFCILDGNVKRIIIRCYSIKKEPFNKKLENKLWNLIENITPFHHIRQFNQGLMDIGSLICTPNNPKCYICPLSFKCNTYKKRNLKKIVKNKKPKKITKKYFFLIIKYKSYTFLKKMNSKKIWGDLYSFPIFKKNKEMKKWIKKNDIDVIQKEKKNEFIHFITHFKIRIFPVLLNVSEKFNLLNNKDYIWYNTEKKNYVGLPKPVQKILTLYFHSLN
ncbi:A/G-specific adenine glycosylase [Buchnera aphidicola (Mindarus keteleerifoliae)]|uniref:A/G-specific adenine glycosylase n=1 Tax=Buchnera aphidicola TaxID=9 RepID=UPI0031B6D108